MKLEPWKPQESLLQDTILVLRRRQGASLAQIRKRLELYNGDGKLDEAKNKMLSSTLKNLVLKGKVEKNGGVYKLARGNPAEQENEVPSRRRRAFPANAIAAITNCDAAEATDIVVGDAIAAGVATAAGTMLSLMAAANATGATTSCDAAKVTTIGADLRPTEFDTGAGGRGFTCNAKSNPSDAGWMDGSPIPSPPSLTCILFGQLQGHPHSCCCTSHDPSCSMAALLGYLTLGRMGTVTCSCSWVNR